MPAVPQAASRDGAHVRSSSETHAPCRSRAPVRGPNANRPSTADRRRCSARRSPRAHAPIFSSTAAKARGGLLAGGGDILDRARIGGVSRRAAHVTECNLNGRRQPIEPFGAARFFARIPRPKPGGRMARRDIAQYRRRFGQHPIAVDERRHPRLRIDAQVFRAVLLVGRRDRRATIRSGAPVSSSTI